MKTPLLSTGPAVLTTLALVTLPAVGTAEPATRTLADTCAMCHGTDGRSPGSIDELFGESAEEFAEEMMEFKYEGEAEGRIMNVIAQAYTDEQIRALARYFALLPRREERP